MNNPALKSQKAAVIVISFRSFSIIALGLMSPAFTPKLKMAFVAIITIGINYWL